MKRSKMLDHYKPLVGEELLTRIYRVASSLSGIHVLHLNTTAEGGGVAELLHSLLPLMEELGIPHSWNVIPLDEKSG
jgi:trehalose synthase